MKGLQRCPVSSTVKLRMPSHTPDLGERERTPGMSQPLGAGPERERVGAEMGEAWREEGG